MKVPRLPVSFAARSMEVDEVVNCQNEGCVSIVLSSEIEEHKEICFYRRVLFSFSRKHQCPLDGCSIRMSPACFNDHLLAFHQCEISTGDQADCAIQADARGGYVFALQRKNTCLLIVDVRSEAVVLSMLEVTFDSERCRIGAILLQGRTEEITWTSRLLHLALWSKRSKRGLNLKRAYFNSFAENGVIRLKFAVA
ncbi:hypothetical protein HPB52_019988 [Rhipicephalus sanguineus]|uniref:Uncharacterized protein n=1 Tax=Rhipicephalus sanguineus TaxID=34632 RepID=A0A9D4PKH2_RHISA|nr:hypothetical protein HPB52_019988 [Rhipicephalus sanguineus]